MNTKQEREFIKFIRLLHDNELLKETILIGSWAEFIYEKSDILPAEFEANLHTLDMDFLLKNLRKPMPPKNLLQLARENGYVIEIDSMEGTSKIHSENLEIEFLIGKKGAGLESTLKTNMGIVAQSLRHMDVLSKNVLVVQYFDYEITVPTPEAYFLHKIIINKDRGVKAEKDMRAIKKIYPFLNKNKVEVIINTLSKKERKIVNNFFEQEFKKTLEQILKQGLDGKIDKAKDTLVKETRDQSCSYEIVGR